MDDQDTNLPGADSPVSDQSGRRDFIKKMVMAGAFAVPVVATFARGARGTSTLSAGLADNAGAPAMKASNMTKQRTKNAALPTTTTVKPASKSKSTTSKAKTTTTTIKGKTKSGG